MNAPRLIRPLVIGMIALVALAASAQDGERASYIVFASNATADANEDVLIVDTQGNNLYNLTAHPGRDWHPAWSPDGTQIVFTSDRTGDADLYLMDADGTNLHPLTATPSVNEGAPAWSPDGERIAYIARTDTGTDLYMLALIGDATPERLTEDGIAKGAPAWSPDNRQIAFWRGTGETVPIVAVDRFTRDERVIIADGSNNWPAYSPTGDRLAFFRIEGDAARLYAYDFARDSFNSLSDVVPGFSDLHPAWSPDGSQIAFASDRGGPFQIYTQIANGAGTDFGTFARPLTALNGAAYSPDWQPIAAPIVFEDGGGSMGLSVRMVQDTKALQNELLDANGRLDVIAPTTMRADEVVTVRVELRSQALIDGAAPSSLPPPLDLAARLTQAAPVYTYMGARLDGFDLDSFQIRPNPTDYVIQVDPTAVNYWEWRLRPVDRGVNGLQDLIATVYLPSQTRGGVTSQVVLLDADISIEVTAPLATPVGPVTPTAPAIATPDPAIRVIYTSSERFSLIVLRPIDVQGLRIAARAREESLAGVFDAIDLSQGMAQPSMCLHFVRFEGRSPIPRACETRENFTRELGRSDVFWYDFARETGIDTIIRDINAGTTLAICSASDADGCAVPNLP
ncbi:MAG: hypothetical protein SGJ24_09685 [Chloroflexota bacterium]|nr:hypothetical protein [Chloroflexota bacterium]